MIKYMAKIGKKKEVTSANKKVSHVTKPGIISKNLPLKNFLILSCIN